MTQGSMAAGSQKRLRFGRKMRVKQGRDFSRLRREGQRISFGCLTVNWLLLPVGAPMRAGVVVGSKLGSAVVRSRAKRLLREAFRLHQHDLTQPVDVVLVARPSIVGKSFAEVEKDFLTTLRKAVLLKETM